MLRKGLVVALVVGLVMAGIAIARDRGRVSRSEPFTTLPAHSVTEPSKTVGAAAARSAPLTKVIYRESDFFNVPPSTGQDQLVAIRCPRRSAAIGGYFGDKHPGVVLDYSAISPTNVRKWQLGLLNTVDGTPNRAFVGVVCIK